LAFAVKISGESEAIDMKCDIECAIGAGFSPEKLAETIAWRIN
jgi:hypothetical protein